MKSKENDSQREIPCGVTGQHSMCEYLVNVSCSLCEDKDYVCVDLNSGYHVEGTQLLFLEQFKIVPILGLVSFDFRERAVPFLGIHSE